MSLVNRINKSFFKVTMNQADVLAGIYMMTSSTIFCYSFSKGDKFYVAAAKTVILPILTYTICKSAELFGTQKFYNQKQKNKI